MIRNRTSREYASKLLIGSFICYKQLKCTAKSIHHASSFNKSSTYFAIILKRRLQRPSVLCSSASVLVFNTPEAEDAPQIVLHLISPLCIPYLPQHRSGANSKWASASVRSHGRAHKMREPLSKSCSDNTILSSSALPPPPAPAPSITCCRCIQIRS